MVPSQHEKILRVFDLVRKEEADALQTLGTTVDIVAQEKVVGLGRESSIFKQAQKVGVSIRAHSRHTSNVTHNRRMNPDESCAQ